ncbi:monovalent cation/H(+) antiporter subunit G [Ancylobacter sp. 6x-1]|uniref:Monovalent cation/H(+) antiporter subunit G n=1 Tax=Ancylobacter crimeensis TaxID=2579147 RepID=A0ABT0D619_9HYPH|nr:monovalent cation/H(+) antiporter subunit G [Ancylobacter crimeensis]MCK0195382.1 monovalent cation/H(+) antiporter subunit G [Ancylobacter crimeensis]
MSPLLFGLPGWVAVLVGVLVVAGALITLVGSFGLIRLPDFYSRGHAPSLGATVGGGTILVASVVAFTALRGRLSVHEILIAVFLTITTPVTLMMLGRASLYRDRIEGRPGASGKPDPEPDPDADEQG